MNPEYVKNKQDELAYQQGYIFSETHAERPITFFRQFLRHSKGDYAGKPLELLPWQSDELIRPLFGWVHKDTLLRRFRRVFCCIPKKNGKSTLASGVGLFMLVGDREPGAEVYTCAVDQKQASIVHGESIHMVDQSPVLSRRLEVNRSTKTIYDRKTLSTYAALSKDAASKEGFNIHCAIVDEIHVIPSHDMWDTLLYGGAARKQPLIFVITTAGICDPESLGFQEYTYAKNVREGHKEDIHLLPVIYESTPEEDWKSPEVHQRCNPSWELLDKIEWNSAFSNALEMPRRENNFRRRRLNQWLDSYNTLIPLDLWDQCEKIPEDLSGCTCWAGLDLSSHDDITALVLVFKDDETYLVKTFFFLPADNITRLQKKHKVDYLQWKRDGHLILTPGDVIDHDYIERFIVDLAKEYYFEDLAYDPWNSEMLAQHLAAEQIETIKFAQNYRNFNEPTKKVLTLLSQNNLKHDHNPVMRWMVSNSTADEDRYGHLMPTNSADKKKNDGVMALIMATGRAMLEEDSDGELITFI